jgi:hypothetical protein
MDYQLEDFQMEMLDGKNPFIYIIGGNESVLLIEENIFWHRSDVPKVVKYMNIAEFNYNKKSLFNDQINICLTNELSSIKQDIQDIYNKQKVFGTKYHYMDPRTLLCFHNCIQSSNFEDEKFTELLGNCKFHDITIIISDEIPLDVYWGIEKPRLNHCVDYLFLYKPTEELYIKKIWYYYVQIHYSYEEFVIILNNATEIKDGCLVIQTDKMRPTMQYGGYKKHISHEFKMYKYRPIIPTKSPVISATKKELIKKRCSIFNEELIMKSMHPSRLQKYVNQGYDIEDLDDYL